MTPSTISRMHVLEALSRIDRDGAPAGRDNRSVELRYNNHRSPPKLVISVAAEIATGRELPSAQFITAEAERFLRQLGFETTRQEQPESGKVIKRAAIPPPSLVPPLSAEGLDRLGEELVHRAPLHQRSDLKRAFRLLPDSPGVYVWFFRSIPPKVPAEGCVVRDEATL